MPASAVKCQRYIMSYWAVLCFPIFPHEMETWNLVVTFSLKSDQFTRITNA